MCSAWPIQRNHNQKLSNHMVFQQISYRRSRWDTFTLHWGLNHTWFSHNLGFKTYGGRFWCGLASVVPSFQVHRDCRSGRTKYDSKSMSVAAVPFLQGCCPFMGQVLCSLDIFSRRFLRIKLFFFTEEDNCQSKTDGRGEVASRFIRHDDDAKKFFGPVQVGWRRVARGC